MSKPSKEEKAKAIKCKITFQRSDDRDEFEKKWDEAIRFLGGEPRVAK